MAARYMVGMSVGEVNLELLTQGLCIFTQRREPNILGVIFHS